MAFSPMAVKSMLNIRTSRNDRTRDHQPEREEGNSRDGATEPQDFSVGDEDGCQVLEDGVYGDGEE
jgi:hypothetical protein